MELGFDIDPLTASIFGGLLAHVLQTVSDKPWWNANTRRILAVVLAALVSFVVWFSGSYPASWELFVSQAAIALATAQTAFTLMRMVRLPNGESPIDWLGRVTPGGESRYKPQHSAERE